MSDFLAEASVLIRPDTTAFRAQLEAQVLAATKGLVVPVSVVSAGGAAAASSIGAATAATTGLTTAQSANAAAAVRDATAQAELARVFGAVAVAARLESKALAEQAAVHSRLAKGAGAAALSLGGLRGAVLAANPAFLAGTVAAIAFGKSVGIAVNFDRELNVLKVTAGATAAQMEQVSKTARALGNDLTLPGVSASDAAVAMTELTKAGLSVDQAMAAARGTLQLATAAQIDNAKAVEITASALNAFNLSGDEAVHVADLLANASVAAQGSIEDMGNSLRAAATTANLVGLSVQDTVEFLTSLQKAGLAGELGGTALKVAIQRLIVPTTAIREQLDKLREAGVRLRTENGAFNPDFFNELKVALDGMTAAQRQHTLGVLGGTRASQAFAILTTQTTADLSKQGTAAELAGAQVSGLGGDFEGLKNKLADLGLTLGHTVEPALEGIVSVASETADTIQRVLKPFKELVDLAKQVAPPTKRASGETNAYGRALHYVADSARLAQGGALKIVTVFIDQKIAADDAATAAKKVGTSLTDIIPAASAASVNVTLLGGSFRGLIDPINQASAAAAAFIAQVAAIRAAQSDIINLSNRLLSQQIQGASGGEQIATIQARIAANQAILKQLGGPRGKRGREALQAIASDTAQIASIQASEAAAAKSGASAAAKAEKSEQEILDAEDQRLLTKQQIAQTRIEIQQANADSTKSLVDDLDADRAQLALIEKQLVQARKIHDDTLRLQTIQQLTLDRIAALKQLADDQEEQRQAIRDRKVTAAENAVRSAELDADLARTLNQPKAEIAALLRENAALEKEKALWKGNTLKQKEIRNQIAENNKAIKDIKKQADDRLKDFRALEFTFLQTQAGFASTLLSNLLPGSATAGTVGGGAISTATAAARGGPGDEPFGNFTPHRDLSAQTQVGSAVRGASSGQMNTLIGIQRAMLNKIGGGKGAFPEAQTQSISLGVSTDYMGW